MRPDLEVRPIRGNVETRVGKVLNGDYDGALMAAAGLIRLGLVKHISERFSVDQIMPAPGQAALAVQCRRDDLHIQSLLGVIDKLEIRQAVEAERAFLARLEAGCSAPIGALARTESGIVHLDAVVYPAARGEPIKVSGQGTDPIALGIELAEEFLAKGAGKALAVD
jgi:hydroxymethylbilane synthase